MTTIEKSLDLESTNSTNIQNILCSRITCKEGESVLDDMGSMLKQPVPMMTQTMLSIAVYAVVTNHEIRGSDEGLQAKTLASLNSNKDILQYIETNSIRGHCSIRRQ